MLTSTEGSGSGTIGIDDTLSFVITLSVYRDASAPSIDNIVSPTDIMAWNYFNAYIDTDNDNDYDLAAGTSLSAAQKNILTVADYQPGSWSGTYSHKRIYRFRNKDSSTHVMYGYAVWRYMVIG